MLVIDVFLLLWACYWGFVDVLYVLYKNRYITYRFCFGLLLGQTFRFQHTPPLWTHRDTHIHSYARGDRYSIRESKRERGTARCSWTMMMLMMMMSNDVVDSVAAASSVESSGNNSNNPFSFILRYL